MPAALALSYPVMCLQIEEAIMPDGVHPSSHGMNLLAQCIAPAVHRIASSARH